MEAISPGKRQSLEMRVLPPMKGGDASTGTVPISVLDGLKSRRRVTAGTVASVMKEAMNSNVRVEGDIYRSEYAINGNHGSARVYLYEIGESKFVGKFSDDDLAHDGSGEEDDDDRAAGIDALAYELAVYRKIGEHKYVAKAFGIAKDSIGGSDRSVLLLEFVDGIDGDELRRGLQAGLKNGHLLQEELYAIGAVVCHDQLKAIKHWSSANIVHCDVKPQNSMTDAVTGDTKSVDFGIAVPVGTYGLGSHFYKAPEQFGSNAELKEATDSQKTPLGEYTDVFAVGASVLSLFEGNEDGLLRAEEKFRKLEGYIEDLASDLKSENENCSLKWAVSNLKKFLNDLIQRLINIPENIQLSQEQAKSLSDAVEKDCRIWVREFTNSCAKGAESYDVNTMNQRADESEALSEFVASIREILAGPKEHRRNALRWAVSLARAPNTGVSIDRTIRKDKFGNVVRDRGVLALETDFTRFIDKTMKSRCTADEALSMPFIKNPIVQKARAKELLKMVVAKTRDGSIFKPKVGASTMPNAPSRQRAVKIGERAPNDAPQFKSTVDARQGAGFSITERKAILEERLSLHWSGWRAGSVRSRASFYDRLAPAKAEASQAGSFKKGSVKQQ
jgi:serine/threonine protein kinase